MELTYPYENHWGLSHSTHQIFALGDLCQKSDRERALVHVICVWDSGWRGVTIIPRNLEKQIIILPRGSIPLHNGFYGGIGLGEVIEGQVVLPEDLGDLCTT